MIGPRPAAADILVDFADRGLDIRRIDAGESREAILPPAEIEEGVDHRRRESRLEGLGGVAGDDSVRRNVLEDERPGRADRAVPYGDAAPDIGALPDPNVIADLHLAEPCRMLHVPLRARLGDKCGIGLVRSATTGHPPNPP